MALIKDFRTTGGDSSSTDESTDSDISLTMEELGLDSGSTDSTSDSTDSTSSTDDFQDPEEELIEASLGTSEGTDLATGSNILAGGGQTTTASQTANPGSTEVDPELAATLAQDTERMVEGDDPDIPTPEEAFEQAQAAAESAESDLGVDVDTVTVGDREVHPFLLGALGLVAVAGYKTFGG